jgi:hypothetical protein
VKPVKHAGSDVCYRGPSPDIGDLWCMRERPGLINVVYELDDAERAQIAAGGRIMLGVWNEPIPPLSMRILDERQCRPVDEHPWKVGGAGGHVIAELEDPERS